MLKITGLDKLSRDLKDAQVALAEIDGELGTVNFDPESPESIDAAISQINAMVDEKLARYSANPIIGPLASEMKEKYREAVIERAAQARLEEKGADEQGN
jgi:hypothetical protein